MAVVKWFVVSVILVIAAGWWQAFFGQFLPPPQQITLAIRNVWNHRWDSTESFRFVLCWIDGDDGRAGETVEEAFADVGGVQIRRSARRVISRGAKDSRSKELNEAAGKILNAWRADLAIIGLVKEKEKALSLWFLSRDGEGTVPRGDLVYVLQNVTLQSDFHEDLRQQLTATALSAAASAINEVDDESRENILVGELRSVIAKIRLLIERNTIRDSKRLADLQGALGIALITLGIGHTEEAQGVLRDALKELNPDKYPLDWAKTQNNLGITLTILGELKRKPSDVEEAIKAFRSALEKRKRGLVATDWAKTQNNLGIALKILGEQLKQPRLVHDAVKAFNLALEVRNFEADSLEWAKTQINLGNAFQALGKLERAAGNLKGAFRHLDAASNAFSKAIQEYRKQPRNKVFSPWVNAHYNLGNALSRMGQIVVDGPYLHQSVKAYSAALQEYSPNNRGLKWAKTQQNLGISLLFLGVRDLKSRKLKKSVVAFEKAIQEYENLPRTQVARMLRNSRWSLDKARGLLSQLEKITVLKQ